MKRFLILAFLLLIGNFTAAEEIKAEQTIQLDLDKVFGGATLIRSTKDAEGQNIIITKKHTFLYFVIINKAPQKEIPVVNPVEK